MKHLLNLPRVKEWEGFYGKQNHSTNYINGMINPKILIPFFKSIIFIGRSTPCQHPVIYKELNQTISVFIYITMNNEFFKLYVFLQRPHVWR